MEDLDEAKVESFRHAYGLGMKVPSICCFYFWCGGVSRVLTHQLVRHRGDAHIHSNPAVVKLDQFEYVIPPKRKYLGQEKS